MKINGHKVKRIKFVELDDIKETKINPQAMFEHIDDVEDLLFLTLLCGVTKDIETPDGKRITSEEIKYLPPLVASELLGKSGVSDGDAVKFLADVQAGENKIFEKYWTKYSEVVKEITGGK